MNTSTPEESVEKYLVQFDAFQRSLNGAAGTPFNQRRKDARDVFASLGFPTMRHEEWRFTNIGPFLSTDFELAPKDRSVTLSRERAEEHSFRIPSAARIVVVNGRFAQELSDMGSGEGYTVTGLAEAIKENDPVISEYLTKIADPAAAEDGFLPLNTAFLEDGAFIRIHKNAVVEQPLHVVWIASSPGRPTMFHPRILIVAETGSSATVVESFSATGGDVYFTNAACEIVVKDNAALNHYRVQSESEEAFHIANMHAALGRDVRFTSLGFSFGGKIARHDFTILLNGEGTDAALNGVSMPRGKQLMDFHTRIDHVKPHCNSREVYKGILDDEARGVFSGRIIVRPGAQKTDAKQSNDNLLLSPTASADAKPQLEIFADDVKCTHGATVGSLSDESMFYLRSRGISEQDARNVLSYAFAVALVNEIDTEPLRDYLDELILRRLHEQGH